MSLNTYSTDLEATSDQYWSITNANQTGLGFTGDCSFECWLNGESFGVATINRLFTKFSGSIGYHLNIDQNDKLAVIYENSSSQRSKSTSTSGMVSSGDNGVWFHLAITIDVSTATILAYKDGVSIPMTKNETSATSIGTFGTISELLLRLLII